MKKKISIIVPVYNSEKYLEECLDSLINQSYKNYEIILVNDGSTDNSFEICEKYSKKYKKIKLYNKKNEGVSVARNFAISKTSGDYIFFVDSDDIIQNDTLSTLISILEDSKADLVFCGLESFSNSFSIDKYDKNKNIEYTTENYFYQILKLKYQTFNCGVLIPKSYFCDIKYPENRYFEDLATMYKLYHKADKIIYNPVNLYKYRYNPSSIVNKGNEKKGKDYLLAVNEFLEFIKNNYQFTNDVIDTYLCNAYVAAYKYYGYTQCFEKIENIRKNINLKQISFKKKVKLFCIKYNKYLTKLILKLK